MNLNGPEDNLSVALESDKADQEVAYPNIKATLVLFFILLLNSLIVAIPIVIIDINLPNNLPILKSLIKLASYIIPLLLTINYAVRKSKKQQGYPLSINFNKIQGWLVPVIIIGALAMIIPLAQSAAWIPMPESVRKFFERTFTKDIFSIATAVIAAPILEEIICRGIILKGLLKNYPSYKAILISAIFFSVVHLNPWQAIPAFFYGLFLGWIYYKTQSVIPGMIIHATINVTAMALLFLPGYYKDFLSFFGLPYYQIAFVTSLLIFTATCIIVHKKALIILKPIM
jgi:membrane protease YdiL (CAAX protease family)